jgi:hypothetical protein
LGLFAFLGGVVAMGIGVGVGRQGFGLEVRYAALAVPGFCAVYFLWELYGPRRCRWLGLATFLTYVAAMIAISAKMGGLASPLAYLLAVITVGGWLGGHEAGPFVRYATLAVLGLYAAYYIWDLWYDPSHRRGLGQLGRAVPVFLGFSLAAMLYRNTDLGLEGAARIRKGMATFEADLRAGVFPFVLADHYSRHPFSLYPDPGYLSRWLVMLHDAGVVPFRDMRPDPDYQVVALTTDMVERPDEHRFILKKPRFVYAVRLKYAARESVLLVPFRFTWKEPRAPDREHVMQYWLRQEAKGGSLLIWIDKPLEQFAVFPDPKSYSFELLVPAKP